MAKRGNRRGREGSAPRGFAGGYVARTRLGNADDDAFLDPVFYITFPNHEASGTGGGGRTLRSIGARTSRQASKRGARKMERTMKEGYGSRRMVASYGTYAEAQGAVDRLADEGFPVERLSIVDEGLGFEERVIGRKGYGRAVLEELGAGALPGALIGFVSGFVFGLFGLVDPLVSGLLLALYGFLFGALLGAVFGLISHTFPGGRRDFSSVGGMREDSYDVVADEEVAEEASRLLAARS